MNKGIFTRLTRPLLQQQSLLSIANVIKHRHAFGLVNNHGAFASDLPALLRHEADEKQKLDGCKREQRD